MPLLVRYPTGIEAGTVSDDMVLNVDFPATFLDYAGQAIPEEFQGCSIRPILEGSTPDDWRTSMYYRYWMHLAHHHVYAHYGIRTHKHKLIYYYADALGQGGAIDDPKEPEWELFDLVADPLEMTSVYGDPTYAEITAELKKEMYRLQSEVDDERYEKDRG